MYIFNKNKFFEELNSEISNQIKYNHLVAQIINEMWNDQHQPESDFRFFDGIGYFQDESRGKWLSLFRDTITATAFGQAITDRYLKVGDVVTQGQQGVLMPRNGTLTTISGKSRSMQNWYLEVRKNGSQAPIVSQLISSGKGISPAINIDFQEGDWLQIFCDGNNVSNPIAKIELAWRYNI